MSDPNAEQTQKYRNRLLNAIDLTYYVIEGIQSMYGPSQQPRNVYAIVTDLQNYEVSRNGVLQARFIGPAVRLLADVTSVLHLGVKDRPAFLTEQFQLLPKVSEALTGFRNDLRHLDMLHIGIQSSKNGLVRALTWMALNEFARQDHKLLDSMQPAIPVAGAEIQEPQEAGLVVVFTRLKEVEDKWRKEEARIKEQLPDEQENRVPNVIRAHLSALRDNVRDVLKDIEFIKTGQR